MKAEIESYLKSSLEKDVKGQHNNYQTIGTSQFQKHMIPFYCEHYGSKLADSIYHVNFELEKVAHEYTIDWHNVAADDYFKVKKKYEDSLQRRIKTAAIKKKANHKYYLTEAAKYDLQLNYDYLYTVRFKLTDGAGRTVLTDSFNFSIDKNFESFWVQGPLYLDIWIMLLFPAALWAIYF